MSISLRNYWEKVHDVQDTKAREYLILHYTYLVKYIVDRMMINLPAHIERDDMVSYGIIGLIDAIEKYDINAGVKFETYAPLRIQGAIKDALRALDWVPRSLRHKAKKLEKAYEKLESEFGRKAVDEEIASYLGIELNEFYELLSQLSYATILSLDESFEDHERDAATLMETVKDNEENNPGKEMEQNEEKYILAQAVDGLSEKEKMVVALYYFEELTLKEIGKVMNLSESRISQIHTKAVFHLRGKLNTIL